MRSEPPLASPCVEICALDDQDVCMGCQRTVEEITRWSRMDNTERREVLRCCQARAQAGGYFLRKPQQRAGCRPDSTDPTVID